MSNTIDPNAWLTRKRVAEALTAMGLPTAPSSLATAAEVVAVRWLASLAPLEPVLVRTPAVRPRR